MYWFGIGFWISVFITEVGLSIVWMQLLNACKPSLEESQSDESEEKHCESNSFFHKIDSVGWGACHWAAVARPFVKTGGWVPRAFCAYVSRSCRFLKVLWVLHWAAVHSEGNTSLKRLTKGGLYTSPVKVILILLIQYRMNSTKQRQVTI